MTSQSGTHGKIHPEAVKPQGRNMNSIIRKLLAVALFFAFNPVFSVESGINCNKANLRPYARLPFFQTSPVIDGKMSPGEWETLRFEGLSAEDGILEQRDASVWIGCDKKKLYIAVQSDIHPGQGIISRAKASKDDSQQVLMDDTIEIWLAPSAENLLTQKEGYYYQLIANANNAAFDVRFNVKNNTQERSWRGKYESASKIEKNTWTFEIAIDLDSLDVNNSSFDVPWGIRVCRNWQMPWRQGHLNPLAVSFADIRSMPLIQFDENAPVIQQLAYRNKAKDSYDLKVRLKNTSSSAMKLAASLGNNEIDQPRFYNKKELQLASGAEEIISYNANAASPDDYKGVSEIIVKSQDGKTDYFARDYAWQMRPRGKIWDNAGAGASPDFDFAYYPSLDKFKIRIDTAIFPYRDQIKSVRFIICPDKKDKIIAESKLDKTNGTILEKEIDLPELPQGDYEVKVFLEGGSKVPEKPLVQKFERRYFLWEKNKIGISEKILPGFSPITIDGNCVNTVLRQHKMSETGLWEQVTSKGKDILAGPMSLIIKEKGKEIALKPTGIKFNTRKPSCVNGFAEWSGDGFSGKTSFEYDYDGMMKVTLTFSPQKALNLDMFRLSIPLNEPSIPLMHIVTDGIRITDSCKIPDGEGIVWDSLKANRNKLKAPFVPYIWIGGPARGICWFADTDRNWILDRKKPSATISREKGRIILNIDFINATATVKNEISIVFGMQATPVKEKPSNWRSYGTSKSDPYKWGFFGASAMWTGANVALWPLNRDYSILRKLDEARHAGKADRTFLSNLYKGFDPINWYKTPETALKSHFIPHVEKGFAIAASRPDAMTTYTNPTGALMCTPEWWTFQDEWTFESYRKRDSREDKREILKWNETATNISQSRIDFMMWYYKELLESAFDGIYWDNVYPHAVMNQVMGNTYKLPDGETQGSVNIFAFRELVKRTAVLSNQLGKPASNMLHMTTSNLIPVCAFGDMTLDWEWKYGMDDFQDRFSTEYILTESTGIQSGCIPFILPGIYGYGPQDGTRKAFVERTFNGWTIVHELKPASSSESNQKIYKILYKFGYGKPDCKVYNWWDEDAPVKISGGDAKFLLLQNGNNFMIVIVSNERSDKTVSVSFPSNKSSQPFTAIDCENNEKFVSRNGSLEFNLPQHDYKILSWSSQP